MMKKFAVLGFSMMMAASAFAGQQTLTGTVTDTMCVKKHMMPGKSDAECIRECVKAGSKYALKVGDKVYVLNGGTKQLEQVAGKKATVTGDVNGTNINVASVKEAR